MAEDQITEYKESWRDEYLRQICGLANTHGGSLLVGIDDNGDVCGIADVKRLMEDIPNKVRDVMGNLVEVSDIEAWGRGIDRIVNACKTDGFSTPEFRYDPSGFWTTFKYRYPERATINGQKSGMKSGEKSTKKSTKEKYQENLRLGKTAKQIMTLVAANSETTGEEMAKTLGLSPDAIRKQIRNLRKKGLLRRVGPDKGGHWECIDPETKE